jgi:hypothetical protein
MRCLLLRSRSVQEANSLCFKKHTHTKDLLFKRVAFVWDEACFLGCHRIQWQRNLIIGVCSVRSSSLLETHAKSSLKLERTTFSGCLFDINQKLCVHSVQDVLKCLWESKMFLMKVFCCSVAWNVTCIRWYSTQLNWDNSGDEKLVSVMICKLCGTVRGTMFLNSCKPKLLCEQDWMWIRNWCFQTTPYASSFVIMKIWS